MYVMDGFWVPVDAMLGPSVTKTLLWGSYCKDAVFLNSVNVAFIALLIMSESVSLLMVIIITSIYNCIFHCLTLP